MKSIYSSMGWRVTLDMFSRGSFIIITIFIARRLGVEEFGKFGYAIALSQIFYIFTDFGMHLNLIKELGEQRGKNEKIWKTYLDIKLVLMVLVLLVFSGCSMYIWKWEDPWLPVAALFWMFGNSILDFNQHVCNGLNRLDVAKTQMLIQRTILICFAGGAILWLPHLNGILMGLALGSVLGALISTFYFCQHLKVSLGFSINIGKWKKILVDSIPNAFSGAFGAWYLRLGVVFLAWIWSSKEVGEYSAAFRIFEASYIVPAALMAISVPHLSEALQKGREMMKKELGRVAKVIFPMAFVWGGGLYLFSPLIIKVLFGSQYLASIRVLQILAITSTMVFINYFATHLMIVFSKQRRHALHQGITFLFGLTFYSFLIPRGGAVGAAKGLLLTEIVLFAITVSFLLIRYTRGEKT